MNKQQNTENRDLTATFGNTMLVAVKWVCRKFGDVWCLFVHGLIRDKHKMHKAYDPMECQICGRWWEL